MGNFSKFPTCPPFSMLLSDYLQINLGDSTIKFSPCRITHLTKLTAIGLHDGIPLFVLYYDALNSNEKNCIPFK